MDKNTTYILLGIAALGVVVFAIASSSSSATSYGISPGTASTVGAIVTANANALNTQAGEQVSLAQIDANLVGKLADSHNTLALGENNNTTAVSLAGITAETARLSDANNYQEAVYGLQTNLQSALAGYNARTAQTAITAGASESIASTNANAQETISANNASAIKNGQNLNFWSSIAKTITAPFSGIAGIGSLFGGGGTSTVSNTLPAVATVGANTASASWA